MIGCINLQKNTGVYSAIYLNLFSFHLLFAITAFIKKTQIINHFYGKIYDNEINFKMELDNYSSQQWINKFYHPSKIILNGMTYIYCFDIFYNIEIFMVIGIPKIIGAIYIANFLLKIIQMINVCIEYERNYRYLVHLDSSQNRIKANKLKEKIDRLIIIEPLDYDCCICFVNDDEEWVKLKCNHFMHKKCIIEWIIIKSENSSCPICRIKI